MSISVKREEAANRAAGMFNWQGIVNKLRTSFQAYKSGFIAGAYWQEAQPALLDVGVKDAMTITVLDDERVPIFSGSLEELGRYLRALDYQRKSYGDACAAYSREKAFEEVKTAIWAERFEPPYTVENRVKNIIEALQAARGRTP